MNQTALLTASLCAGLGLFVLFLARPLATVFPKLRWCKPVWRWPDSPELDPDAVLPLIRLLGVGLVVAALFILVTVFALAHVG